MNIHPVRSDDIYQRMMVAPEEKRNDLYRYEMMGPFKEKWAVYNIPIKAPQEGGYDIVMASEMLGILAPKVVDRTLKDKIALISQDTLWETCTKTIQRSLDAFTSKGYELPVKDYTFTILLSNPESPFVIMNDGYCGDGGIPGYILLSLNPSDYTIQRMPAALAHECNHNIRFQFEKWRMDITLAEMMVSEGLAENFATEMFGEELLGPWVSKTDAATLKKIKPMIKEGLNATGFDGITPYLYGDEIAKMQGYKPVGLPYSAGYACGYHLIKHYLKKTDKTIVEATVTPSSEIMAAVEDFWDC